MFGKSINLFRLFGFQVQADLSWLILAFLITWSLATGYFPDQYLQLSMTQYWGMGVLGAIGLFGSLIFHELSHSLVARRFGIPMKGITLFIFGGVAHMEDEPPNPKSEFFNGNSRAAVQSGIGRLPVRSHAGRKSGRLAGTGQRHRRLPFFHQCAPGDVQHGPGISIGWRPRVSLGALGMDGDIRWATRLAARFGSGFGIVLIVWGGFNFFTGNLVGGLWYVLIGFFLYGAAHQTYQQVLVNRALRGESVRRFMSRDPVTVSPDLSVQALVDDYLYRYLYDMFPVLEGTKVVGCASKKHAGNLSRAEWPHKRVADIMEVCSPEKTVQADSDAGKALAQMNKTRSSRLQVLDGDRLVGVIALKDLLKYLAFRLDLEEGEKTA